MKRGAAKTPRLRCLSRFGAAVGVRGVPRLSYFYGITITMYWSEPHHHTPHFHALYGEHEASLDLTGEVMAGHLPKQQLRLVQAWAELHMDELSADWDLAAEKKPLNPIAPLR